MISISFDRGRFQATMNFSFTSEYFVYEIQAWHQDPYSSRVWRDEFKNEYLEIPMSDKRNSVKQLVFQEAGGTAEIYLILMVGYFRIRLNGVEVDVPYENVLAEMRALPFMGEKMYRKYYTIWKECGVLTKAQEELMGFDAPSENKGNGEGSVVMEMASALMEQQKAMMEQQAKLLEGTASKEEIEARLSSQMTKLVIEEFKKIRQELKEEREREKRERFEFEMKSSQKETEDLLEGLKKEGKKETPIAAFSRHARSIRLRIGRKMLKEKATSPQTSLVLREEEPVGTMEASFVRLIWNKYKDRFKGAAAELFLASVPYLIRLWTGEK